MAVTHSETSARPRRAARTGQDAIKLLKDDHKQVKGWFDAFDKAGSAARRQKLADQICLALRVHAQIEEEIFYPACREAGVDNDTMDEADVEHDGAEALIDLIEAGRAGDDHWDAKVTVLGEMVKHHVKEEEQPRGMFAKARQAGMDLRELGAELKARKDELMKVMKRRH